MFIKQTENEVMKLRVMWSALLQVAVGLITAKASHVVWPPSRWQRIKSVPIPSRLVIREPSTDEQMLSPIDFEETLLNNNYDPDNPKSR